MPMDRRRYPKAWESIALQIKTAANWTCEACNRPCRRPGELDAELVERIETDHSAWAKDLYEWQETEEFGAIEIPKLTRFTLTTAHPNHDPENPDAELKAWCSPCHCRYDLKAMGTKKRLKLERSGQLTIDLIGITDPIPAGQGKDPTRIQLPLREELGGL
ncbi:HNH endonuclease [Oculatella sp. LEGE 06141]|uniref:HNH endonuclease n=1 Tax=Oculatella sp. LEGE 06141 TaxID=1828648 RepID=UPI00187E93D0|nr:HNH endonuclease [Oculatella sp. LEGE 06141]MBE9178649.1 HNH endonuclease [Oculatella sp. LEGE 06141]